MQCGECYHRRPAPLPPRLHPRAPRSSIPSPITAAGIRTKQLPGPAEAPVAHAAHKNHQAIPPAPRNSPFMSQFCCGCFDIDELRGRWGGCCNKIPAQLPSRKYFPCALAFRTWLSSALGHGPQPATAPGESEKPVWTRILKPNETKPTEPGPMSAPDGGRGLGGGPSQPPGKCQRGELKRNCACNAATFQTQRTASRHRSMLRACAPSRSPLLLISPGCEFPFCAYIPI